MLNINTSVWGVTQTYIMQFGFKVASQLCFANLANNIILNHGLLTELFAVVYIKTCITIIFS